VSLDANARRFSGFADLYDAVRPVSPQVLADVITTYAGGPPEITADLGSGTGLSTRWAAGWAGHVIGVEPNADMRIRAAAVTADTNVSYVQGWSHATDLPDESADVALAVQALHWMDPSSTFDEVARILRPGGVFAALDCDWPPAVGSATAEQAWHTARAIVAGFERELGASPRADTSSVRPSVREPSSSPQTDDLRPINSQDPTSGVTIVDGVQFWHKEQHLRRMVASGHFSHCIEVAALGEEHGNADRFVQLFCSQGDYQALRRHGYDDEALGVERFSDEAKAALGDKDRPFWFTYRARIGVRPDIGR
jgi:ubiquinone/menaquinone biosynthesis C-methylase UbiE